MVSSSRRDGGKDLRRLSSVGLLRPIELPNY